MSIVIPGLPPDLPALLTNAAHIRDTIAALPDVSPMRERMIACVDAWREQTEREHTERPSLERDIAWRDARLRALRTEMNQLVQAFKRECVVVFTEHKREGTEATGARKAAFAQWLRGAAHSLEVLRVEPLLVWDARRKGGGAPLTRALGEAWHAMQESAGEKKPGD